MLFRTPSLLVKLVVRSFLVWIVLSTIIPQAVLKYTEKQIQSNKYEKLTYPYNLIVSPTPLPIQNSTVYFVIGHPDDEVMFFSLSLIELAKKKHNNQVKILCFSKGDSVDVSMGHIRTQELIESARILGVDKENVVVLDKYLDGMNVTWDSDEIRKSLVELIDQKKPAVLVTFDESGVSNHPNHISLYHGTKLYFKTHRHEAGRLYVLKSLNMLEKYSFTFLTNLELFVDHISKLVIRRLLKIDINISFFSNKNYTEKSSIKFYSDLNMLSVSYAAMAYGHFSQMVWFRYGWLILSRYLTFNHLIEIS